MSCFQLFNLKGGGLGNQRRPLIIKVKHTFFLLSFVAVNDEGTENVDFQCGVRGGVGGGVLLHLLPYLSSRKIRMQWGWTDLMF